MLQLLLRGNTDFQKYGISNLFVSRLKDIISVQQSIYVRRAFLLAAYVA